MEFSRRKIKLLIYFIIVSATLVSTSVNALDDEIIDIKKGYVVTSAYGGDAGEEIEIRQVDLLETSPFMIIDTIISENFPVLGDVVVILLFSTFFAGFGYFFGIKLVNRKNVLDNENRNRIYRKIKENPGISFTEIVKELGITKTMAKYHLDRLMHYGLIIVYSNNGRSGYFRNNVIFSDDEKLLYIIKKNPHDRRILEIVKDYPGITRKEIISEIKLSGPSVTWHMERLESSGLIEVVRDGRFTRYYIKPGPEASLHSETKAGLST